MQQEQERWGYVAEPEYPDAGKVKMKVNISFKPEQLKKLLDSHHLVTDKGNIRMSAVFLNEGGAFLSVYDPTQNRKPGGNTNQQRQAPRATSAPVVSNNDLPF